MATEVSSTISAKDLFALLRKGTALSFENTGLSASPDLDAGAVEGYDSCGFLDFADELSMAGVNRLREWLSKKMA